MKIIQQLHTPRHMSLSGVRLRVHTPGSDVWVTLTDGESTLAATRLSPAMIAAGGTWATAEWTPVNILAGQQIALEIVCSDTQTELGIARIGERDPDAGAWASKTNAAIGDLLTQDETTGETKTLAGAMLSMQLLEAIPTGTVHDVPLAAAELVNCTDMAIVAASTLPDTGAQVSFRIALAGGLTFDVPAGQRIELDTPYTGTAAITARLTRSPQGLAPILAPGTALAWGSMAPVADYIGAAFDTAGRTRLRVIHTAKIPSGAAVAVQMQPASAGESDPWTDVPFVESSANTAGFIQYEHEAPIALPAARVRLVLTGQPKARPFVDDLRAIALQ